MAGFDWNEEGRCAGKGSGRRIRRDADASLRWGRKRGWWGSTEMRRDAALGRGAGGGLGGTLRWERMREDAGCGRIVIAGGWEIVYSRGRMFERWRF